MHKCCTLTVKQIPQRRINGLQFPLNFLQIIGWIVFVVTGLLNFILLTQIQFDELKTISVVVYSFLYTFHIFSHFAATLLDPGEEELRKSDINIIPEFDRSVHAHVIENGRCHLCNINTTDKRTKHCGLCNKCVYHFDHHCKWLNNCVGQRNYLVFILCVISALFVAIFTSVLCLIDMYLFFKSPQELSTASQKFVMCTKTDDLNLMTEKYCMNSISFLTFLIIFCISALAIAFPLLHLLCFHVYISILGLSTYEYIMRNTHNKSSSFKWCRTNIRKLYVINHNKVNYNSELERNIQNESQKDNTDLTRKNFISTVVTEKLNKSRKTFFYDNKIHPSNNEVC